MLTHFQGQIRPYVRLSPILQMIVCYISPSLLEKMDFDFKNIKISHGHSLRPLICIRFYLKAMLAHLKGKKSLEARIPPFLKMIICYRSSALLVIANSDNTKISRCLQARPLLSIRLAFTVMPTLFQGPKNRRVQIPLLSR